MCLIKSMTAAVMLTVFISTTAYATENCTQKADKYASDHHLFQTLMQILYNSSDSLSRHSPGYSNSDIERDNHDFSRTFRLLNTEFDCCQHFGRIYEHILHNLNRALSAWKSMELHEGEGVQGVHILFYDTLKNLHRQIGDGLVKFNDWGTTDGRLGIDELNPHIQPYSTVDDINLRNFRAVGTIENYLDKARRTMHNCQYYSPSKRFVGPLGSQPKMEARNAPLLPAESAAGRWEYVARENPAFHPQQEPVRLDSYRESVDPLDDMVRQIRVYDKLQEIRKALKRSDELSMDLDDMREVRAYDQQARPRLVAKRNEYLTNTWVDGDAPDTYYVEAKRDAETLGPFVESGERSVRRDSLDQALKFKRALQFLDFYLKK